jgi:hypothetical protein
MFNGNPRRVRTGVCRASYVQIVEPRTKDQNGNPLPNPKYSAVLLIPKTDAVTLAAIQEVLAFVQQTPDEGPKVWGFNKPAPKTTLHDGDALKESGRPYGEECHGHWVLSTNTTRRPGVVNQQGGQVPLDVDNIYSGMFVIATLTFFANNKGGADICCALDNLQKVADGPRLAGGPSADEDFSDTFQSTAAAEFAAPQYAAPAQYAPAAPAYPAQPAYPPPPYAPPTYTPPTTPAHSGINPMTGLPYGAPIG